MEKSVGQFSGQLEEFKNVMASVPDIIADSVSKSGAASRISGIKNDLEKMMSDWNANLGRIDAAEKSVAQLYSQLDEFKAIIEGLPNMIVEGVDKIEGIEKMKNVKRELDSVKGEWSANLGKIDAMEKSVGQFSGQLEELRTVMDSIPDMIIESEEKSGVLGKFMGFKKDTETQLDKYLAGISGFSNEISEFRSAIQNIPDMIIGSIEKMGNLDAIKKDVFERAEELRKLEMDSNELLEKMSSMNRRLEETSSLLDDKSRLLDEKSSRLDEKTGMLENRLEERTRDLKADMVSESDKLTGNLSSMYRQLEEKSLLLDERSKQLKDKFKQFEDRIGEDMERIKENMGSLNKQWEQDSKLLDDKSKMLEEKLEEDAVRLEEKLGGEVRNVSEKITDFNNKYSNFSDLQASLLALKDTLNDKMKDINSFLQKSFSFFDKISEDLDSSKKEFNKTISERVSGAVETVTEVADKSRREVESAVKRIENLNELEAEVAKQTSTLNKFYSDVNNRVNEAVNFVRSLEARFHETTTVLDNRLNEITNYFDQRLQGIESPAVKADDQLRHLMESVLEIQERLGNLEKSVHRSSSLKPIVLE